MDIEKYGAEFGWTEEEAEDFDMKIVKTGFPKPYNRFRLVYESPSAAIEETYFWMLEEMRQGQAVPKVEKLTDVFSASENSAFWGQSSQRLGIQQDKVAGYMATIGKMVKDLFALVRELRIIDERLQLYKDWGSTKSSDVTLKGIFIDLVEGGTKNPSSVYGLAQQVGFTILPDLFFNTQVYSTDALDPKVNSMTFNKAIKNILKRKLYSFIVWKKQTEKELNSRRKFNLKYLRQHWGVIKMYMSWVKPYLRNIARLSMSDRQIQSPDLISSFESSMTEIEIMGSTPAGKGYNSVVLATFKYRTRPGMSYRQEYQQGPIHIGRIEVQLRSYGWHDDEMAAYKKMRDQEDMEMLGVVDGSVKAAMEALGEELENYLKEAGEEMPKKEEPKKKKKKSNYLGAAEPFISVFKGFGELFGTLLPRISFERDRSVVDPKSAKAAAQRANSTAFNIYKFYKKSHRMLAW